MKISIDNLFLIVFTNEIGSVYPKLFTHKDEACEVANSLKTPYFIKNVFLNSIII